MQTLLVWPLGRMADKNPTGRVGAGSGRLWALLARFGAVFGSLNFIYVCRV